MELHAHRVGELVQTGLSTHLSRTVEWECRAHGLVRPAGLAVDPSDAAVDDALALAAGTAVLSGWAALRFHGNGWFDGRDRGGTLRSALLLCPPGTQLRRRAGVDPVRALVHPDEVLELEGHRVATRARSVFDEMCRATTVRESVVTHDLATSLALGRLRCTPRAVAQVVSSHRKTRGLVQARRALELGNSRSASPWETRTRLVAVLDAGLTGLVVNQPLFDESERLLGVADVFDPATGLVIESDGAQHREADSHAADNEREERFEQAGCIVVRVSALDHGDRQALVARLHAGWRLARESHRRAWTTDEPAWWRPWADARSIPW